MSESFQRRSSGRRSRSPRISRRRSRARSIARAENKSSSPVPSPGSWNVVRGRSRVRRPSNPFSEDSLRRKGYHSLLSSFGKVFHVEKRWKLVREMGSGAYGVVISAADEITKETVAIKLVTRVFDKVQLAKRALREITLLRHFSNHENITGLIDVDAISRDFNEIYIFMEPMEADLHQIIKSGQTLTSEHVQYFLYQILRGMKYIHSASVVHRDLKPGNLLVNANCELKICDFGLSRGFDATPDETAANLTEYVATRWYRAPEIMLAFKRYNTAIDVWSIGCIFAELLLGRPLFKGKDYVDQLNKVLDVLGTPDENIIIRIGSDKAQAYVRSLPWKKTVPFTKILPMADTQALGLLSQMLKFDPSSRLTVVDALEHPWLSVYHDAHDEPECPDKFEKWRQYEQLETLEEFREALWNEIEEYRREVRGLNLNVSGIISARNLSPSSLERSGIGLAETLASLQQNARSKAESESVTTVEAAEDCDKDKDKDKEEPSTSATVAPASADPKNASKVNEPMPCEPKDPMVTYSRRPSMLGPSRQGPTFNSPMVVHQHLPTFAEGAIVTEPASASIAFPSQSYIVPARSRTGSTTGAGEVTRKLLRTLSTVSIHESVAGLEGGLAGIAPIGKFIVQPQATEADAPPSEMPRDFGIDETSEEGCSSSSTDEDKKGSGRFQIP